MESYPVMAKQELLKVSHLLQKKCTKYSNVHFLKSDADWVCEDVYFNKALFYKDNLHLVEKGNEKLALRIRRKLNTIKESFRKINNNERKTKQLFSI